MTARPLYKVDSTVSDADRVKNLERRLETERRRRLAAEADARAAHLNTSRMHALLIAERIRNIQTNGGRRPSPGNTASASQETS